MKLSPLTRIIIKIDDFVMDLFGVGTKRLSSDNHTKENTDTCNKQG